MRHALQVDPPTSLTCGPRHDKSFLRPGPLPVGVSDQRQAAVVPRNLPKNRKDKEQHLEEEKKGEAFVLELWHSNIQTVCDTIEEEFCAYTHQEAHEVQGEDGGHPPERQPLQHRAADPSRVAVRFVIRILVRAVVLANARLTAAEYRHGNDQHSEHA